MAIPVLLDSWDPVADAARIAELGLTPPKDIVSSRFYDTAHYCAGVGNRRNPTIMFVATALQKDEAVTGIRQFGADGRSTAIESEAQLAKGEAGRCLRQVCKLCGLDFDKTCYYTTIVKWFLPDECRSKPKRAHYMWGLPTLREEIRRIQPKVIVALGKDAFDQLYPEHFTMHEIEGAFFQYKDPDFPEADPILLMPSASHFPIVTHADKFDGLVSNITEAVNMATSMDEGQKAKAPVDIRVVDTLAKLRETVDEVIAANPQYIAFDCEWGGLNHLDGQLRMTQISWKAGTAAVIKFCDAAGPDNRMPYTFDTDYKTAGKELQRMLDAFPRPVLAGHQASADMPWWEHVLGVKTIGKVGFDTLYALQCANEYLDGKLERCSVMFTRYGRYDVPVQIAKKQFKIKAGEGYARIPDEALIPYSGMDAIVTWEIIQPITKMLLRQGAKLFSYYKNECLPFVTDVFTRLTMVGLPVNREAMDQTRELFLWAREEMERDFKAHLKADIWRRTLEAVEELVEEPNRPAAIEFLALVRKYYDDNLLGAKYNVAKPQDVAEEQWYKFKPWLNAERAEEFRPLWHALWLGDGFNQRTGPDMRNWLYGILKLTPLRSTGNKEQGRPAMAWEKVMRLKPERRKLFQPATDKGTLAAYVNRDKLIGELYSTGLVRTITTAFLRPGDTNEETGEVEEDGLHSFISSSGRIHGLWSLTESARIRSFAPNTLNLPAYVNKRIVNSVADLLQRREAEGTLPDRFRVFLKKPIRPIRGHIQAPPGYCIIESDLQTAELRGLAFISGCEAMIKAITEPDPRLVKAVLRDGDVVNTRKLFPDALPKEHCYEELIDHAWTAPQLVSKHPEAPKTDEDGLRQWFVDFAKQERNKNRLLLPSRDIGGLPGFISDLEVTEFVYDKDGKLKHSKNDLHWALAELVFDFPREMMNEKVERGAGKVGNFCLAPYNLLSVADMGNPSKFRWESLTNVMDKSGQMLWDGKQFVHYAKIYKTGTRQVITYHGITATPEHIVWGVDGKPIPLIDAACLGIELASTTPGKRMSLHLESRESSEESSGGYLERRVSLLRSASLEMDTQLSAKYSAEVSVPVGAEAGDSSDAQGTLGRNVWTLRERNAQKCGALQGAGDPPGDDQGRVCELGAVSVSRRNLQEQGLRSDRQRWALQHAKSSTCDSLREPEEQEGVCQSKHENSRGHLLVESEHSTEENTHQKPASEGADTVGDPAVGEGQLRSDGQGRGGKAPCANRESPPVYSRTPGCEHGAGDTGVHAWVPGVSDTPTGWISEWFRRTGVPVPSRAFSDKVSGDTIHKGSLDVPALDGCAAGRHREAILEDPEQPGNHGATVDGEVSEHILFGHAHSVCKRGTFRGVGGESYPFEVWITDVFDIENAGPDHRFTVFPGIVVSNSSNYGATSSTLERRIESDTGNKPEEGTGQKILDSLDRLYPVARKFLIDVEKEVETGKQQGFTGRIRHYFTHAKNMVDERTWEEGVSPLKRESKNFYLQHSVASVAAIATRRIQEEYEQLGMGSRVIAQLYDAVITLAPIPEREEVKRIHEDWLFRKTCQIYHGRELHYPVDHKVSDCWSFEDDLELCKSFHS